MSAKPEEERTFLDDNGRPVEFHAYPESADVREATIRRLDDDSLVCEVLLADGETREFSFTPLKKMFVGFTPTNGDRDDIPREVLDALVDFGYAVDDADDGGDHGE